MTHQPGTKLSAQLSPAVDDSALGRVITSMRPSAADIRGELQRVIDSVAFDASDRNRRFLRYVVEETLEGRSDRIKAYNVATTVFGRNVNFDPQLDPVVRMEAQRLRRSLERFYLTEGRASRVRIFLPKGCYVPQFHCAEAPPAKVLQDGRGSLCDVGEHIAGVLVTAFDDDGGDLAWHLHESGLAFQLMIGLSADPRLVVLCGAAGLQPGSWHADLAANEADFILTGSKTLLSDVIQVKAVLLDALTGKVLWGRSFERSIEPEGVLAARDGIAKAIVAALTQPGGVLGPGSISQQGGE